MEWIERISPRSRARLAGLFEFLEGFASPFGQVFVLGRLVVSGDAAATASNILGHERLFRLGFASCVAAVLFHLIWAFLIYNLFRPISRSISLLSVFVILVGCAIQAVAAILYLAPLLVLQAGSPVGAIGAAQSQALALLLFQWNGLAYDVYLVFFGFWCVLTGQLIVRATFMPRLIGVLLTISGVGWMLYLSPPFAHRIFPFIAAASALGELPLELWLLVFGVNNERWKEQAATNANP